MKALTLTGSVMALCIAANVNARDLPSFTAEGYCLEVAEYENGNEEVYDGCIDIERGAYEQLMKHWGTIPQQIKAHCVALAISGGESYSVLNNCIGLASVDSNTSTPGQEEPK